MQYTLEWYSYCELCVRWMWMWQTMVDIRVNKLHHSEYGNIIL
jgi:hypothetical protein